MVASFAVANGASAKPTSKAAATAPGLTLSATSLSFGNVQLNTSSVKSVTVTSSGTASLVITSGSITGKGFAISGETLPPSVKPVLPITLTPGETLTIDIAFAPAAAGAASGSLSIVSNATTATVSLSGTGQTSAALSAVSCSSSSLTGAATDACKVTLTSAAGSGGVAVTLSSSNSSLKVPASVTVPSGGTSASFTATAAAVSTAQTATITAAASGITKTASVELSPATATLALSSSSIAFGNVKLSTPATQSLVLTASGTEPLTISAASLSGNGFSMSGASFPLTLAAGKTATLEVTFDPASAGAASGTIAIASNCSMGAMSVSLSGTGIAASYSVDLAWEAPSGSSDPVAGYKVYRAVSGGSFELLDATGETLTTYSDTTAANGTSYVYQVTSVDAKGNESAPSNSYSVAIP